MRAEQLAQDAEISRLEALIAAAPHDEDYPCNSQKDGKRHPCICWKAKANRVPPRGQAHG